MSAALFPEREKRKGCSYDLIDACKTQSQKRRADLEAEMKQDEENEFFAKRLKSIEPSK